MKIGRPGSEYYGGSPAEGLVMSIVEETVRQEETSRKKEILAGGAVDWKGFKDLIFYHQLVPAAYASLKGQFSLLPQELTMFLKNAYYYHLARHQRLWQEFLNIMDACQPAGIDLVPLKGIALYMDVYANFPSRPMTDIDLLSAEGGYARAEQVLSGLGYEKYLGGLKDDYRRNIRQTTFFRKVPDGPALLVDLHSGLDFERGYPRFLPDLWKRTRFIDAAGRRIRLLSVEDTLFNLALHLRQSMNVLYLKNVCDLGRLLHQYAGCLNWDYLREESRRSRIRATLFFALNQAEIFSGVKLPERASRGIAVHPWQRRAVPGFIRRNTFVLPYDPGFKAISLKTHFLIYDTLREPVGYVLNIPLEQFAKFNELEPYAKKTRLLYRLRQFYFLYILIRMIFRRLI